MWTLGLLFSNNTKRYTTALTYIQTDKKKCSLQKGRRRRRWSLPNLYVNWYKTKYLINMNIGKTVCFSLTYIATPYTKFFVWKLEIEIIFLGSTEIMGFSTVIKDKYVFLINFIKIGLVYFVNKFVW